MESIVLKRVEIPFMVMICLLFCLFARPAMGIELLAPENRALMHEAVVTVVVDIAKEPVKRIEIVVDGNQTYLLPVIADKSTYCKKVPLKLGENRLDIKGFDGKDETVLKSLTVYYTSPVEKAFKYPSKEYQQTFFHTQKREAACTACHNMEVNEVANVAFENVTDSNCYACHKGLAKNAYAHAPTVNWLCTSCHNGKTGMKNTFEAGKSKYLFPDPIGDTCLACHNNNKTDKDKIGWDQKLYHHDPAESGRCNRCHNPHSSANEAYLRKPSWELCVGCHADKAEGMHVANISFVRSKHPTKGVPDPTRPGKELSCISCHNPHASNKRFFLPDDQGNKMICTMCHKK